MSKTGIVKFFNEDKAFGFIVQDDGAEDLFAHKNQIADGQTLVEGDAVRYDVVFDDRKGKNNADNITGGSGGEIGQGGFGGSKGKGGFGGGGGKGYRDKGGFSGGFGGRGGGDGKSIYVNGFDFGADEDTLRDHFGGMGNIAEVSLQGKGAAIISYTEPEAAQQACRDLDRTTMNGHQRYCTVKMDGERSKGKGKGKKY